MPEQRRFSPRVRVPYTARLWSTDAAGRKWKEDAVLDNISTGGLYLRLNRRVREGAHVHVVVCLSTAAGEVPPRLRLAAHGLCYGANRSRITPGVSPWNSAAGVFCELQIRPRSDAYVMGSPRLMQRQLSSNFFCRAPKWEGSPIAR